MSANGISTNNNWTLFVDVKDFRSNLSFIRLLTTDGEVLLIYATSTGYRNASNTPVYPASWELTPYNDGETPFKFAFQYDGVNLTMYINADKKESLSNSLLSANFSANVDELRLPQQSASGPLTNINQTIFFDEALSDADCITLTT